MKEPIQQQQSEKKGSFPQRIGAREAICRHTMRVAQLAAGLLCLLGAPLYAAEGSSLVLASSTRTTVEIADAKFLGTQPIARFAAKDAATFLDKRLIPALPDQIRSRLEKWNFRVLFQEQGPAGLFDPREIKGSTVTLTLRPHLLGNENLEQVLSHEFFHAIHFLIYPDEEPWIREGLAQLFEYLVLGRFNGINVAAAFETPSTPLMGHYDHERPVAAQYGHNLLYSYYLFSQCGGSDLFWSIASGSSRRYGADNIDAILRGRASNSRAMPKPQCSSFEESAVHFEIARIHNRQSFVPNDPNRSAYHLLSSSFSQPPAMHSISSRTLRDLKPFTPIVLLPFAQLKSGDVALVHRFWIQSSFPFRVSTEAPKIGEVDAQNWRQLVIRR